MTAPTDGSSRDGSAYTLRASVWVGEAEVDPMHTMAMPIAMIPRDRHRALPEISARSPAVASGSR